MFGLLMILFLILFILTLIKPVKGLFWIPDVNKRSRWFSLLYLLGAFIAMVIGASGPTSEENKHTRYVETKLKKYQINTSSLSDEDKEIIYDSLQNKECLERELDDIRREHKIEPVLMNGDFEFNYYGSNLKASLAYSYDNIEFYYKGGKYQIDSYIDPDARQYNPNDNCTFLMSVNSKLSKIKTKIDQIEKEEGEKLALEKDRAKNAKSAISNTRKCIVGYDWVTPDNVGGAFKFNSDGTYNFSTKMFGGMTVNGNWDVRKPNEIRLKPTYSTTGKLPKRSKVIVDECVVLKVGQTTYIRY